MLKLIENWKCILKNPHIYDNIIKFPIQILHFQHIIIDQRNKNKKRNSNITIHPRDRNRPDLTHGFETKGWTRVEKDTRAPLFHVWYMHLDRLGCRISKPRHRTNTLLPRECGGGGYKDWTSREGLSWFHVTSSLVHPFAPVAPSATIRGTVLHWNPAKSLNVECRPV